MSRKKTSIVWKHFSILHGNDVRCSHCYNILKFSCGSTHNLIRHLRFKHKNVFTDVSTYSDSVTEEIVQSEAEQSNVIIEESDFEQEKIEQLKIEGFLEPVKCIFEESHLGESQVAHSEEIQSEILQTEQTESVKTETVPEVVIPKAKNLKKTAQTLTPPPPPPKRIKLYTPQVLQSKPEVPVMQRQVEAMKTVLLQEESEFDAFGRNVALQLKQMPLKEALLAQQLIHGILRKHRVRAINKEHHKNNKVISVWEQGDHTYLQTGSNDNEDSDDA